MLREFLSLSSRRQHKDRGGAWRDDKYSYASDYCWVLRYPLRNNSRLLTTRGDRILPDISILPWSENETVDRTTLLKVSGGDLIGKVKACRECGGEAERAFETCDECAGDGYLIFDSDRNEYEVECRTCKGNGVIRLPASLRRREGVITEVCSKCGGTGMNCDEPVQVGRAKCDPSKMLFIVETVGPVWMKPAENEKAPLYFNFGLHGDGFIMPTFVS